MLKIDSDCSLLTALVDPIPGVGLFLRPDPTRDVAVGNALEPSLHAAAELAFLRQLAERYGYELDEDWQCVGSTVDGRDAVLLYGNDYVIDDPCDEQLDQALRGLCAAAGVIPRQRRAA